MDKPARRKARRRAFALSPEGIDSASDFIAETLDGYGIPRRDALRTRLSFEEVLLGWSQGNQTAPSEVTVEISYRFGRVSVSASCAGVPHNPLAVEHDEAYGSGAIGRSIMENLGLSLSWSYHDGRNTVSCLLSRKRRIGQFTAIAIALFAALTLGGLGLLAPEAWRQAALDSLLNPLFDAFLNAFSCIVGPLMFLSMIWGISNIGDMKQLGTIGSKLLSRFLLVTIGYAIICLLVGLAVFAPPFGDAQSGQAVAQSIVEMLLGIIPPNIVAPFAEGNTLQILFMGAVVGIAVITLRDRVNALTEFFEQANTLVQLVLGAISSLTPAFVFLSILCLVLDGAFAESALGLLQVIALSAALSLAEIVAETLALGRLGLSPAAAAKKLAEPFLVALTTASSAVSIPVMLKTCREKLGIDEKLANFALPFGSVVFMPHVANSLILVTLFAAHLYGVELTVGGLAVCLLNAVVLSIAAPPIPGGAITCYTLMFMQLGIPLEALSLAVAADIVLDFIGTAGSLHDLSVQLTFGAKRLGMLDEDVLKD